MTDIAAPTASQILAGAQVAKTALDAAAGFSPLMGPAGPAVVAADVIAGLVINAANTVYAGHAGGASWLDSFIEVLQHLSPTQPNSPILSATK